METSNKLLGSLQGLVYHCLDRIVIQGYLPLLTRSGHLRLANSLFHHWPEESAKPPAKIETAYHKADDAIQKLIDLLAARRQHHKPPSRRHWLCSAVPKLALLCSRRIYSADR